MRSVKEGGVETGKEGLGKLQNDKATGVQSDRVSTSTGRLESSFMGCPGDGLDRTRHSSRKKRVSVDAECVIRNDRDRRSNASGTWSEISGHGATFQHLGPKRDRRRCITNNNTDPIVLFLSK